MSFPACAHSETPRAEMFTGLRASLCNPHAKRGAQWTESGRPARPTRPRDPEKEGDGAAKGSPDSYGGGRALAGVYGTREGWHTPMDPQMRDPGTRMVGGHGAHTPWRRDGAQGPARDAPLPASRSLKGARKSASDT